MTITSVIDNVLGNLTAAALAANGNNPIVLNPGQNFAFSFMTTSAQDAGTVVNTVTATGQDDEGNTATDDDSHTLPVSDVLPSITIDKTGPATIAEGNTATYDFTITNTRSASTDPVTITSVIDNVLGNLTAAALAANGNNPIVLNPGQNFAFSFMTTSAQDAGTVVNTVTATGQDDEGNTATDDDSHTLPVSDVLPSITIDKTGPATIAEGNTATYNFTITNTSSASTDPVTITSVIDNVLGNLTAAALAANGNNPIVLNPGQNFAFSFMTTSAQDAGTVVNTVTATGQDDEGNTATDDDSHTLPVSDVLPSITIDKTGPATIAEGNRATYNFTITNTNSASTDPVTITSVIDNVLGNLIRRRRWRRTATTRSC